MALPSGTIDHAVFEQFWHELDVGLRDASPLGRSMRSGWRCMARPSQPTAKIPRASCWRVAASCPVQKPMAASANGLVAYRENPHSDAREAAADSARLLARTLETGVVPHMLALNADIVWPPTGTGTADSPMRIASNCG